MSQIANRERIEQILERMVFQIAENNYASKKIIFVGVKDSGWMLAKEIIECLTKIQSVETVLVSLEIDKKHPEKSTILLSDVIDEKSDSVILVDDVINSGRTIFYALKPFLDIKLKNLQTLVLVERKYKRFPIVADYVGISLNTTMKEHIEVVVDNGKIAAIELI
jgi:pyrimidine operon attenuation protein/uracil phosphoribosyltransferase